MTRFEIIEANKAHYEAYLKKIKGMTGLTKLVAENLVLAWIKGNKWMGGLSDSKYQSIYEKKFEKLGYTFEEVDEEFESQIEMICNN